MLTIFSSFMYIDSARSDLISISTDNENDKINQNIVHEISGCSAERNRPFSHPLSINKLITTSPLSYCIITEDCPLFSRFDWLE
jgi:hypothetical protein